ncbi:hypothetical protein JCM5296_005551 [Sporobolomyces johnsonii]
MNTDAASPAAPAPIITCPYTAGGCPLFNTIDLPPSSPRCAGSCSPAATPDAAASTAAASSNSKPSPPRSAPKSSALSSIAYDDSFLLSELQPGLPLPAPLGQGREQWGSYLNFGISPGQLEIPFFAPLPEPSALKRPPLSGSDSNSALLDIEELLPTHDSKRTRLTPPPALPNPTPLTVSNDLLNVHDLPMPSTSSSDEENEVVTPFISKLTYLLEHEEYQPWVRWDASGNYILIAHTKPHLLDILARYFRHTTIASFVRQLNIYGFKRATTGSLLTILETVSFPQSVVPPGASEPETFSAADFSAFSSPRFFRSVPGGRHCRLGQLKPITKERGPRNRGKKAQAAKKRAAPEDESP